MLTSRQKNFYEDNGYLMVEDVITKDQLNKLQDITYDFIESSRQVTENDDVFDLDEGHSAENPRLTRIKLPHKQNKYCLLYTSPSPRDRQKSRMPSSA